MKVKDSFRYYNSSDETFLNRVKTTTLLKQPTCTNTETEEITQRMQFEKLQQLFSR